MKIYTKAGDDGTTGLFGAGRVRKDALRVSAYGDVDELNAFLGVARTHAAEVDVAAVLERLQSELFTLGAQLATPDPSHAPKNVPVIRDAHVEKLESEIDLFDAELEPLRSFILPSGTPLAAALHVARTVCRRAERSLVSLSAHEPVPVEAMHYLNRLSDHLFTLSRLANKRAGVAETKWVAQ
jgi:cob(I)alamin adenosyltransferase